MNVALARKRVRGGRRLATLGMTLIEVIVVLAIIAMLSAIVVPTFARLGFFSRNDLQASARELYTMLKAAKIYAATYRVNTAVAYSFVPKTDSVTSGAVEAIDAAALVYKLPKSIADHTTFLDDTTTHDNAFVPINTDETGAFFRSLKPDTAVLPDGNNTAQSVDLRRSLNTIRIYRVEPAYDTSGNRLRDANGEPKYRAEIMCPHYPLRTGEPCGGWNIAGGFAAHIFMSSGRLVVPTSADSTLTCPERFRMYVGYAPDATPAERFADEKTGEFRAETIELSQSTGRVQLGQE